MTRKNSFCMFIFVVICLFGFSTLAQAQVSQTADGKKKFFVFNACMQVKNNDKLCLCQAQAIQKEFSQSEWEQYHKLNSVQNKSESGLTPEQINTINSKVNKITSNCWSQRSRCKNRCPYNGKCLEYY